MCLAYNKIKNIKQNLYLLGLDLMIASESWERPHFDLNQLLNSPNYVACLIVEDGRLLPPGWMVSTRANCILARLVGGRPLYTTGFDLKLLTRIYPYRWEWKSSGAFLYPYSWMISYRG